MTLSFLRRTESLRFARTAAIYAEMSPKTGFPVTVGTLAEDQQQTWQAAIWRTMFLEYKFSRWSITIRKTLLDRLGSAHFFVSTAF